jgi:hypothetical protein
MRLEGRGVLAAMAACGGCGGGSEADLVMEDANNYTQTSDITFGRYPVQEGTDTTLDWSALTTDLRGRPLDPTTVDQVVFSLLEMAEDELKERVLSNDIPQSEANSSTFGNEDARTSVSLSELEALSNTFDPADLVGDTLTTWVATLIDVPEGTSQQQVLFTVVVEPGPEPGTVAMTDGASSVTVVPDLQSQPALQTVADAGPYTLDWSGMENDVFGQPFDNLVADTLVILNYPGTVEDVENDFLLVDYHADAQYTLDVYGAESAQLEEAVTPEGDPFPGFTSEGTWLIGLINSKSLSPLPLVMTVVEVGK